MEEMLDKYNNFIRGVYGFGEPVANYWFYGAVVKKNALSAKEFFSEVKTLVENHNINAGRTGADEKWRMHESIASDLMERLDPSGDNGFY